MAIRTARDQSSNFDGYPGTRVPVITRDKKRVIGCLLFVGSSTTTPTRSAVPGYPGTRVEPFRRSLGRPRRSGSLSSQYDSPKRT
eukprot:1787753-Rhodomonas_salina.1